MNDTLDQLAHITEEFSNIIWPIFIPFLIVISLYTTIKFIFFVVPNTTKPSKINPRHIIGPSSIALGAMVGTGALIGVLGALGKKAAAGQIYIEGVVIWALLGALFLIPLVYCETLAAKIMRKSPREYISILLSPSMGKLYAVAFVLLYVFGFGGFQFNGIDSAMVVIVDKVIDVDLTTFQRYFFIIIPLIAISLLIVSSNNSNLFMSSMTIFISIALIGYLIFATVFIIKTSAYIPIFFERMWIGFTSPHAFFYGVPLGFIVGIQRIIQTSEPGLGALAMAAMKADSEPRAAGIISLIPTLITIFIAIVITSYITSYGINNGIFSLPASGLDRIIGYFETAETVVGTWGLIVLAIFVVLSGITTLLGSFFFLDSLLKTNRSTNFWLYTGLIITAGTLAVFGLDIVFEVLDLLLLLVTGIHVLALSKFAKNKWKPYQITNL